MTEENMIDLLRFYDAMNDLKRALGLDRMSFTYDCLLERLNVGGVICRHARGSMETYRGGCWMCWTIGRAVTRRGLGNYLKDKTH